MYLFHIFFKDFQVFIALHESIEFSKTVSFPVNLISKRSHLVRKGGF